MNSDASWDGPVPSCIGLQCEKDEVLLPNGQTLIFNQTEVGKHANAPIICATSNADHFHTVSRLCYYNETAGASWRDPLYQQCLTNNPTNGSNANSNKTRPSTIDALISNPDNIQLDFVPSLLEDTSLTPKKVLALVDTILDKDSNTFEDSQGAADSILSSVNAFIGRLQATNVSSNLTFRGENVVVAAVKVQRTSFPLTASISAPSRNEDDDVITFSSNEESEETGKEEGLSSVFLPEEILDFLPDENNHVAVSVFVLDSLKLFDSNSSTNEGLKEDAILASSVLSITVEGVDVKNLSDPVVLNFKLKRDLIPDRTKDEIVPRCVFWKSYRGVSGGVWSQEGCQTGQLSHRGSLSCQCTHLTSFAVLLDTKGGFSSTTLDIISILGCSISIFCLIITIGVLAGIRSLRRRLPQQIMINLSSALLGLYLVFVVGVDKPSWGLGCTVIAIMLHYFSLAAVAWMGVEAFSMYLMFVRVVNTYMPKMLLKSCLFAWGCPLVIVCITVAVDLKAYRNPDYCFMITLESFYFAQLLPIALILTINTIIFTIVIYKVTCGRKMASLTNTMEDSNAAGRRAELLRSLQNAVAIGTLVGLSWVCGFMAIGGARFFFAVLFVIFTSLQGVFIFILFCIRLPEVRQQLIRISSRVIRLLTGRRLGGSRGKSTSSTSSRPSNATISYSTGTQDTVFDAKSAAIPNAYTSFHTKK
ncbi:adhesion G-protein coupled receptor G6-like [Lytechinus variegatus]|uniref:adhesion G-protein coupled receptor G6-like n=1 Tax=Lytechinus variegatus TaxID=7654 RepID=UPI001BB2096C|nr:adhesion G-protein coupled receptor G6-like [Lytechinus variegatus]